jgi:cell division protein FtsZ
MELDFETDSIDFKNTEIEIENLDSSTNHEDLKASIEEVKSTFDINNDKMEINDINNLEVISPEEIKIEEQVLFDFDMPLKKKKFDPDKIIHELIEDVNEIEVNNPIHIIPVTEVTATNSNKSSFDDYNTKPSNDSLNNKENEVILNPLNCSIAVGLAKRTDERKIKLKEFNYDFKKSRNLKSIENEPAFKRAGISLTDLEKVKLSKSSIGDDLNGKINNRANNSFLLDNIDQLK